MLGVAPGTPVHEPQGCPACSNTGFKGRVGVFETVRIDDTVRRLINEGGDETAIAAYAFTRNPTLSQAARELVLAGVTTPEEAVRVSRREVVEPAPIPFVPSDVEAQA